VIQSVSEHPTCPLCTGKRLERVFTYFAPPTGEVCYRFSTSETYRREVHRCSGCGHFLSLHTFDVRFLYTGAYVESTYGENGLQTAFHRIIALDPTRSDNVGRVKRVTTFSRDYFAASAIEGRDPTVLDVGSGLCVFLHHMKQHGWNGTALDPDERAARHAIDVVGVKAVCADFLQVKDLARFDLITFNKVLEHVEDPVMMLARSDCFLNPKGLVYVELPDGEMAAAEGPEREEFFIEHHHVFSAASLALLAMRAGFRVLALERLREPSTKYTLFAFLARAAGQS
jgi:2-polyprenyl-3-methyl-5-hydroxy-6-metoxy-1,4-benzoquinol methylase